jgi:hypothetical protein
MRGGIFSIAIISLIIFSFGCSTGKKENQENDGLVKHYDKNGKLIQEAHYKDGKLNGLLTDYYIQNGKVLQEVHYLNNFKHGIAKKFYEDGTLSRVTPYDSGVINGVEYKYRKDGKLISEQTFYKGKPCIGLVEYLPDGSLKTKYPQIVITPVDELLRRNRYVLRIHMSDDTKAVKYYVGKLTDGKYIGKDTEQQSDVKGGVLTIEYYVPEQHFVMEQLNIIAVVKTFHNNDYITQVSYNVSAENR